MGDTYGEGTLGHSCRGPVGEVAISECALIQKGLQRLHSSSCQRHRRTCVCTCAVLPSKTLLFECTAPRFHMQVQVRRQGCYLPIHARARPRGARGCRAIGPIPDNSRSIDRSWLRTRPVPAGLWLGAAGQRPETATLRASLDPRTCEYSCVYTCRRRRRDESESAVVILCGFSHTRSERNVPARRPPPCQGLGIRTRAGTKDSHGRERRRR